jgi:hypothetical protein
VIFMQTFTGRCVRLDRPPTAADIDPVDIVEALSRICRFNGHVVVEHYSVAAHSLLVADQLPDHLKLAGLLHDAHEAYVGDMTSPMKAALGVVGDAYRELAAAFDRAIADRFGLDVALFKDPAVQTADLRALATEKRDVMAPEPCPWMIGAELLDAAYPPLERRVYALTMAEARRHFRSELGQLWPARAAAKGVGG